MPTLGARLKESRENKRLTQADVAKRLGITNGAISGYERNYRDPDTETLRKLAELYEVSVDYLTGSTAKSIKKPSTTDEKLQFLYELEQDLGINLSDPKSQKMLKRLAKVIFGGEDDADAK